MSSPLVNPDSPNSYRTIPAAAHGDYREKGSKFLATACPVTDETAIAAALERIKQEHPKARHCCYAWRLGTDGHRYRANDDQEPSGTAGKPILGRIDHGELTDVLVAVIRYFGGVKLGVPGLIHAYRSAAQEALEKAGTVERDIFLAGSLLVPSLRIGEAEGILARHEATVSDRTYGEDAGFTFLLPKRSWTSFEQALLSCDERCRLVWQHDKQDTTSSDD